MKTGYKRSLMLVSTLLMSSCAHKKIVDKSDTISSIQLIDRNGFAETISNKEKLKSFQSMDFSSPQPYKKVLRVYGRNSSGKSPSKITSYHDNGQIWQYLEVMDGRANGFYREWHPNGCLRVEAPLVEGTPDINELAQSSWVFDGTSSVWDDKGNLMATIPYSKGLLEGISYYYYPDGTIQKILNYEQGLTQGISQSFDQQGALIEKIPYQNDEKHGQAIAFWKEGILKYEEEYRLGLLVDASYYDPKGNCVGRIKEGKGKKAEFKEGFLYSLMNYYSGLAEGELSIFHPNGVLYRTCMMKEGKKEGEEWEYYPAHPDEPLHPKLHLHWHEDKIQGQVKTWYPTGQIESQREITHNKKQGLSFAWYKNGDLMLVEEYEFDRLVKGSYYKKGEKKHTSKVENGNGTATLYTSDGAFLRRISYENGKPHPS